MKPMTDSDRARVGEVAASLTDAEKDAIRALASDDWKKWPDSRLKAMMDGLGRGGLSCLRQLGLAEKGPHWSLTSFGRHVAAFLAAGDR